MALPTNSPTAFCKAFIERELKSNKQNHIWMSYWPVMERMLERADELTLVFHELIKKFGYSDKFDGYPPNNAYIWLTLEYIWMSIDFCKNDVVQVRLDLKELNTLKEEIVELSEKLAFALRRQDEVYELSGFQKSDYQTTVDMIELASEDNHLYQSYVSDKIQSLRGQFDLKYWPTRADVAESIASFEKIQPSPSHSELPESVLKGRASDIKDFVLAFDYSFDGLNGLPSDFRFSNNALADIINVILDLSSDRLATGDAIRIVRNRHNRN
ncbi:hypothetical protein L2719_10080 [Shewanella schlegeliana]|uniref:Uncharacterized protein n=1 Tax=Shewanella schlegeliana TaxID=190308 RepID=A0ABS1SVQ6_9GAMM|nr:hypothetical protein [Shewanella schlegeliana]MBL4912599.1 hypothetical protein [Shewanella schlegeliana]MCL1109894.1 hypothetical protein [Shewanella schlegeliana]GIU32560.1 hypothetical protein TUM4433_25680 [Shewanella schlegeliana]